LCVWFCEPAEWLCEPGFFSSVQILQYLVLLRTAWGPKPRGLFLGPQYNAISWKLGQYRVGV
jgi:hypothetical protein